MMKRAIGVGAILAIAALGGAFLFRGQLRDAWYEARRPAVPPAVPVEVATNTPPVPVPQPKPNTNTNTNANTPVPPPPPVNTNTNTNQNTNINAPVGIPVEYNLAVPFTTQAPFANWTGSYEDGCEEASALMVEHYFRKKTFPSQQYTKDLLDQAFAWEDGRFGYNLDTTAAETAVLLREYFGFANVSVDGDFTAADIKAHIAAGRPVIVPAYGKALLNPNFRNGGPDYHMLVIKGYTATSFITNDPGTRRGADYVYPIERLMGAIHDWNGGDVANGNKAMIVVSP